MYLFGRSGCRSLLRQHDYSGISEKARGTLSLVLNSVAQRILRWAEQLNIILMPQFVSGRNNVVADALSHPGQVLGSEWMLHQDVFSWLRSALAGDNLSFCLLTQSPLLCLFCVGVGSHGCGYGCHAPVMGFATGVCLPSLRHDRSGSGEGEGLSEPGADAHCSILAPASVVAGAADTAPSSSSISVGSSASSTRQKIPPKPVHASSSCVKTLRRFVRASGFSCCVAR